MSVDSSRCYLCGETKPVGAFTRDRSKASGRASRCRDCDNERSRRRYEANREEILARYVPVPPREAVCAADGCGERFIATGRQRYCKPSCRPATGATVEAVCDGCGHDFVARARDCSRGSGRYCSKSCGLRDRSRPGRKLVRP